MYKKVISFKILRWQTNGHGFLPKSMTLSPSFAPSSMFFTTKKSTSRLISNTNITAAINHVHHWH
ncbi:hypothetical protein HanXRQr2_Chr04g0148911 [Helianthus annuus]|uniref:Uncharacterized protein n=1 Tax=Helianthus annuus TaxID=4232 RepID=A0A9K3NQB5_HELAN|nr:hypothetical protein HanXRQr2_Chr04g0148911 [Helianthus annuus]